MKRRETALAPLLRALDRVNETLSVCAVCGNVDTTDPCAICSRLRGATRGCSAWSRRCRTSGRSTARGCFPGRFHVLGGRLSALEGVRPEDLGIDKLVSGSRRAGSTRWCWR